MTRPSPNPNDSTANDDSTSGQRPVRRREAIPIPGIDQILQQLLQLNGAVAIGVMSTKEAHLIQKNLKTVLDVQLKRASREDAGPGQEALIDLCRRDPRALEAIEPFLSDSQLKSLMHDVTGDTDEEV